MNAEKTKTMIERAAAVIEDRCDLGALTARMLAEDILDIFIQSADEPEQSRRENAE